MMKKNKVVICSVLLIVLTACIICTGCTSTQSTPPTQSTLPTQSTPSTQSTSTQSTTATPEQTLTTEVSSTEPTATPAPGDPSVVLVSYPSLFNTGNGAGLYDLLSENMKSQFPVDTLNNELAAAHSNSYTIEKIQVNKQIIEENSAILELTISWKVAGSQTTSTPKFFLVYENNQWKLDSLIVSPQDI